MQDLQLKASDTEIENQKGILLKGSGKEIDRVDIGDTKWILENTHNAISAK